MCILNEILDKPVKMNDDFIKSVKYGEIYNSYGKHP